MDPQFAVELVAAVGIAVAAVRYWKVILAAGVVVVLTLTVIGAVTVAQNWPLHDTSGSGRPASGPQSCRTDGPR